MAAARRARRAVLVVVLATATATAACNALTGAHERFLDDGDSGSPIRARDDGALPDAAKEDAPPVLVEGGEGGPNVVFIDVLPPYRGLNGATFASTDAGTTITAYDGGGANHAVIVPVQQPAIPAEDYTVYATVLAPTNGEFGILTRVQASGAAFGFGSKGFGVENKQFLGTFLPPEWAPSNQAQAQTAYVYVPNGRYKFQLQAVGDRISGKMWEATQPEPAAFQLVALAPWSTGRGVGFYDYLLTGAVLESFRISIP